MSKISGEELCRCFNCVCGEDRDGHDAIMCNPLPSWSKCKEHLDTIRSLLLAVGEWQKRAEVFLGDGYADDNIVTFLHDIRDFGEEKE